MLVGILHFCVRFIQNSTMYGTHYPTISVEAVIVWLETRTYLNWSLYEGTGFKIFLYLEGRFGEGERQSSLPSTASLPLQMVTVAGVEPVVLGLSMFHPPCSANLNSQGNEGE